MIAIVICLTVAGALTFATLPLIIGHAAAWFLKPKRRP